MRRSAASFAVVALALALTANGCGAPSPSGEAEPQGEEQVATVETREFRFSPRTIDLEAGKPITVTVHNAGLVSHTFTSDDPQVDVVVPAGERRTVTFVANGRVSFFCRFHATDGMQGALCPRGEECIPPLFP